MEMAGILSFQTMKRGHIRNEFSHKRVEERKGEGKEEEEREEKKEVEGREEPGLRR